MTGAEEVQLRPHHIAWLILGTFFLSLTWMCYSIIPQDIREFALNGGYYLENLFFPFGQMFGFRFEQLMLHLIWLFPCGAAVFCFSRLFRDFITGDMQGTILYRVMLVISLLSVGYISYLVLFVFRARGLYADEMSYRAMAALFRDGQLGSWERVAPSIIPEPFEIVTKVGLTEKYLFGEPIVQIPGLLLGLPALMHIPLAALTLVFLYKSARMLAGEKPACWAVILLAISPFFVFTSSTGLSQCTSLFCSTMAFYGFCLCKVKESKIWTGALICACAIGFGMCTRPQSMLPVGIVFGGGSAYYLIFKKEWKALGVLILGTIPFACAILYYNYRLTGEPLKLPWMLYEPVEHYGFGDFYDAKENLSEIAKKHPLIHTPYHGVRNLIVNLIRLNLWWLGWPVSLWLIWQWLRQKCPMHNASILLGVMAAIVGFQFFYFCPGSSDTGPVYHYECLPGLCLFGGMAVTNGMMTDRKKWMSILLANVLLGTIPIFGIQTARIHRLLETMHGQSDKALSKLNQIGRRAIIFYSPLVDEGVFNAEYVGFSWRYRSEKDLVVTYPRSYPEYHAMMRARFPDRDCYYYKQFLNMETGKPDSVLFPCDSPEGRNALMTPYPAHLTVERPVITTAETLWFVRMDGVHWDEAFDLQKWKEFLDLSEDAGD